MEASRHEIPGNARDRERIRVVVFDSVPIFRDALAAWLSADRGMSLICATSRPELAKRLCAEGSFDVLIMDSLLDPCCRLVRESDSAVPHPAVLSLVCEPLLSEAYVRTALLAGVHGLIHRGVHQEQLWKAVEKVFYERSYLDPGLSVVSGGVEPNVRGSGFGGLSGRELEVLRYVAMGMTTSAMAEEMRISTETIRSHVKSVCRRLGVRDRTRAVAEGFHRGLLAPKTPPS